MDLGRLLSDPGALATLIAVFLTIISTIIIAFVVPVWVERRQQLQVTYSRKIETPSILAESEINKNLHLSYQGKDVSDLRFFSVNIVNSGKKVIDDFQFLCEFDSSVQVIDPNFPEIFTKAPPAVQPDQPLPDKINSTSNKFQYTVKNFIVHQQITANFLFANCKYDTFDIKFIHPQYVVREESASTFTTLERNIIGAITNYLLFYIISLISPLISIVFALLAGIITSLIIAIVGLKNPSSTAVFVITTQLSQVLPNLGAFVGIIIGLPFLLRAYRFARPLITIVARKLQEKL